MQKLGSDHFYQTPNLKSINQLFYESCDKHANLPFIHWRIKPRGTLLTKTYREVKDDLIALATYLLSDNIVAKRVAIMGENSYSWIVSYYASLLHLNCVVPLDRMLKSTEVLNLINRAKVDTLFIDAKYFIDFEDKLENLSQLKQVIIMNAEKLTSKQESVFLEKIRHSQYASFDIAIEEGRKIIASGQNIDLPVYDTEEPQVLIFTSGTTDTSKGVMLSQRALASDVNSLMGVVNFPLGTRMLSLLPLSHTFENTCTLLCGTQLGAEIYICDGLKYIQENLKEFKISLLVSVPAVFEQMYRRIKLQAKKSGKEKSLKRAIKISNILRKIGLDLRKYLFKEIMDSLGGDLHWAIQGGASLKKEIIDFFDSVGLRICQGYGLTETAPVVAGCNTGRFVSGTVGRALSGIEIYIDSDEEDLPGEILIKSNSIMNGYYEDETATKEAIDEKGFFHTGDLGIIDPKSKCLKITGRLKSMIVLANGKKVFPEEIEDIIKNEDIHFIKDVFVYAHPAEKGDLILTAKFLVDSKDLDLDAIDKLIEKINGLLPSFKRIKSYYFTNTDFMRTTTMKIKRAKELEATLKLFEEKNLNLKSVQASLID